MLLQKPRSPLETYNDLDGNVVNFFHVLRDHPDELVRRIRLTPWAREEFNLSRCTEADQIENARRFFMFHSMAMIPAIQHDNPGFRMAWTIDSKLGIAELSNRESVLSNLQAVASRLIDVQIENANAINIVRRADNANALIYLDPPYPASQRDISDLDGRLYYAHEWTDEDHEIAANLLHQCKGYVVVSGYACPLYTNLYEQHGWERHDREAQTNSGGKRIESFWLSPRTVEALARPKQQGLFG